ERGSIRGCREIRCEDRGHEGRREDPRSPLMSKLRVSGGEARGRRLKAPKNIRPTQGMVKQAIFNMVGPSIEGAEVLDLYAGTGALGIEALSRGAARAVFVDSSYRAIRTIRANLELTGLADRAEVHKREVPRFLHETDESFTLALADPPYAMVPADLDALVGALEPRLRHPGWRAALTRPAKGYTPVIPVDWRAARELKYGDTLVLVYEEV